MADSALNPDFFSIFCGVFLYENKKNNDACQPWTTRLYSEKSFYSHVSKTYYQNYFNNILKPNSEKKSTENSFLHHDTLTSLLIKPFGGELPLREPVRISIPYFDCFLFSDGIGIFCFKVELAQGQTATYQTISQLLGYIRNPESLILSGGNQINISQFIRQRLEEGYTIPDNWNQYLVQLKFYCIINDSSVKKIGEAENKTLFELSHTMPIGTIQAGLNDKPTDSYYQEIMTSNSISIYDNWKAISLLDSFTRISCDYPDPYKTWELDYFHIYIHCLYSKFQLYYFNSQLTDLLQFNKKTQNIRDRFIEFVNDYSLPYISYKFLPNLLYEKINAALEVQKEQDAMERKIGRLNEAYQNKKSQQLNSLLLVISVLSLASVFNDISQWLTNMGTPAAWVYSPVTILTSLGAIGAIGWIIFKRR